MGLPSGGEESKKEQLWSGPFHFLCEARRRFTLDDMKCNASSARELHIKLATEKEVLSGQRSVLALPSVPR